jgi:hypothetical protein
MANVKSANHGSRPTIVFWIVGILVIVLLWLSSYYYFAVYRVDLNWADKGSIGDSYGAVNTLSAGLAFLALIITIYLQSKALRESKADADLQSFENKFFQLTRVHNDILDGIVKYQTSGNQHIPIQGRQRFVKLYEEFAGLYDLEKQRTPAAVPSDLIQSAYTIFFARNEHEVGHYFRHLYSIVAFIDRSSFSPAVKNSYTKLLRAQLSSCELLLLFYNCLHEKGRRKFKPLVEKYGLLEHMPHLRDEQHKSLNDPSAFTDPSD